MSNSKKIKVSCSDTEISLYGTFLCNQYNINNIVKICQKIVKYIKCFLIRNIYKNRKEYRDFIRFN